MALKRENYYENRPDFLLLIVILILLGWGIFTLATVSIPLSLERYGTNWHYLFHQIWLGVLPGVVLGLICFRLPLEFFKKWGPWLFFVNLMLLLLVFLPKIGVAIGGARRWLNLGPVFFQPSEFLKITFPLYLAAWLSAKFDEKTGKAGKRVSRARRKAGTGIRKAKTSQPFFLFMIILAVLGVGLLLQPDMSTAAIILITALLMYFASPTPFWQTILIILGGLGISAALIRIAPYRIARVFTFFHPEADPLGVSYQFKQALIAIGSGKIFGIESVAPGFGLGLSRQKFGFLPLSMSDSIFAIIGEELGFVGACLLVFLFLIFLWRGLKIASQAAKSFPKLLALGITCWIVLQAFCNLAGMTGILPLAGIPLPFFSYGGSHLIVELAGAGILLNISKAQ